jgi:uncharacterized membrane protein YeaQ/YmgE (transglycosylase-associated protein family)
MQMSLMQIVVFLAAGGLAGWVAGMLVRGAGRQGLVMNVVVGILGAFIGGWLFSSVGLGSGGLGAMFLTATVGAVVLLAILRVVMRR